jgi:hypothetical protein
LDSAENDNNSQRNDPSGKLRAKGWLENLCFVVDAGKNQQGLALHSWKDFIDGFVISTTDLDSVFLQTDNEVIITADFREFNPPV